MIGRLATLGIAALIPALGLGFSFRTFSQQLQCVCHHFRGIALVAGLVRPLAGAEFAFDVNLGAFVHVFFCDIGIVAPKHNRVPFGVFPLLAVAVSVAFRGGQAHGGHFHVVSGILGVVLKVTYFRVASNVTD